MDIEGLQRLDNYISETEAAELLAQLDAQVWQTELKRRVQHYGYRYNYKSRKLVASEFLGALPSWSEFLTERLQSFFGKIPDQLIVNDYQIGQGISAHIDCVPCFGETVVSLSLLSPCVMLFSQGATRLPLLLRPRSLLVLQKEARYQWKHAIMGRKYDEYEGERFERSRRVSLTFRTVNLKSGLQIPPTG